MRGMITRLAVAVGLALGVATVSSAQDVGQSDAYVCKHGDPQDDATIRACDRIDFAAAAGNTARTDAAPTTQNLEPASQPEASRAFLQGQADRQRYEAWFASLSGDYLAGASYWTANRSRRPPPACSGTGVPFQVDATWSQGCLAAQRELGAADVMRLSSPDYRRGWNSIPEVPRPQVPTATDESAQELTAESSAAESSSDVVTQPVITPESAAPPQLPAPQGSTAPVIASALFAGGLIIVAIAVGLGLYFLPTIIAMLRKKKNAGAIFALNLFLGWTFLGWLGALIWSLLAEA